MNPSDEIGHAAERVAPIPRGDDGAPVFAAPWEAQAFAMTLALQEGGQNRHDAVVGGAWQ